MKLHVLVVVVGFVGTFSAFFNLVLKAIEAASENLRAEMSVAEIYGSNLLVLLLFLIILALGYIWSDIKDLHEKIERLRR